MNLYCTLLSCSFILKTIRSGGWHYKIFSGWVYRRRSYRCWWFNQGLSHLTLELFLFYTVLSLFLLQVVFLGEEAIDEGGLRKVLFVSEFLYGWKIFIFIIYFFSGFWSFYDPLLGDGSISFTFVPPYICFSYILSLCILFWFDVLSEAFLE